MEICSTGPDLGSTMLEACQSYLIMAFLSLMSPSAVIRGKFIKKQVSMCPEILGMHRLII